MKDNRFNVEPPILLLSFIQSIKNVKSKSHMKPIFIDQTENQKDLNNDF